jgi:hypothetical protein
VVADMMWQLELRPLAGSGPRSSVHLRQPCAFCASEKIALQTGINENPSPLGGMFKDDPAGLELKHDRKVVVPGNSIRAF